MKQPKKIILAMTIITLCILSGMTLGELSMVYGQPKGKPVLSQEFKRDPFSLPPRVHLLSKTRTSSVTKKGFSKKEIKPALRPLKVNAILISDRIRLASIDRHIVTVGDLIQDEKILEIKDDRVILGKGGNKRTLLLSQSPVRLTVEDR